MVDDTDDDRKNMDNFVPVVAANESGVDDRRYMENFETPCFVFYENKDAFLGSMKENRKILIPQPSIP